MFWNLLSVFMTKWPNSTLILICNNRLSIPNYDYSTLSSDTYLTIKVINSFSGSKAPDLQEYSAFCAGIGMWGLVAFGFDDAVVKRMDFEVYPSHDWQVLQGGVSGTKCGSGGSAESQKAQVAGASTQGRGERPSEESSGGIRLRQSEGWLSCWIHSHGLTSPQDWWVICGSGSRSGSLELTCEFIITTTVEKIVEWVMLSKLISLG